MGTLGTIDPLHLARGTAAAPEWLMAGTIWRLSGPINLHSQPQGPGLATQAWAGRHLEILSPERAPTPGQRLRVRLLEDGYPGWMDPAALLGRAVASDRPQAPCLPRSAIARRLPQVLAFANAAQQLPNTYLWGGSLGPDYDCSGLLQRQKNLDQTGNELIDVMLRTCNGRLTAAEALGHREFVLTRLYESA